MYLAVPDPDMYSAPALPGYMCGYMDPGGCGCGYRCETGLGRDGIIRMEMGMIQG